MIKVNVITSLGNIVSRQLPNNNMQLVNCSFEINGNDSEYDYCFVLDDLPQQTRLVCNKKNIILSISEPQEIKLYTRNFLEQFGRVSSFYFIENKVNININIPLLPWMAGLRFDVKYKMWNNSVFLKFNYFLNDNKKNTLNKIIIITSSKSFTKGHEKRLKFIHYLKKELGDKIDIYGNGFIDVVDKYEIMSKYKYALVIENSSSDNYWTEKLSDAYLSNCYPIYFGCLNIKDYFSNALTTINISNYEESLSIINTIIYNDYYNRFFEEIIEAKNKILKDYNLFYLVSSFINEDTKISANMNKEKIILEPMKYTFYSKLKQLIIRNGLNTSLWIKNMM